MYIMKLQLFGNTHYPLFNNAWYECLVADFQLPSLALLLTSLHHEVVWPEHPQGYEVYYLENLREENEKTLLQVRFLPDNFRRDFINLHMSIEESKIQHVTVDFSVRGDRRHSSKMLEELKSIMYEQHMHADECNMLVEDFMETGYLRFVRESKMSGFVWVDELHRYIHVSENIHQVLTQRK